MFIIFSFLIIYNVISGQLAFASANFNSTLDYLLQNPSEIVTLDKIEYSFYDRPVTWEEARIICLGYKSYLATLDTDKKAIFVVKQTSESSLAHDDFWIGSKMNFLNSWIWTVNSKKLDQNKFLYKMDVVPSYENRSHDYCLTLFRKNHNAPIFIPLRCREERPFICERDTSIRGQIANVFSLKVQDKEFKFYLANVTWSEAVVQCRQRGLQIAEVLTLLQARGLASKMLRVRPGSIENAWIGGHLTNGKWKWMITGWNVSNNELWNSDHMATGDCLLLDRHVCQLPTYISTRCDRKRSFLCQTPEEKVIETELVPVNVDACQYWIGLKSLTWSEAVQSCKSLNSTLVSLDTPVTLTHLKHIMIDNRKRILIIEVQHIWTGGLRQYANGDDDEDKNRDNGKKIWIWYDSGDEIDKEGIFVPWCRDSHLDEVDADCLNMDLENFDVPAVYGLNCNITQKYICQTNSKECDEITKNTSTITTNKEEMDAQLKKMDQAIAPIQDSNQNKSLATSTTQTVNFQEPPRVILSKNMGKGDNVTTILLDDGPEDKNENNTSGVNHKKNDSTKNQTFRSEPPVMNLLHIIEYMVNKMNQSDIKNNTTLSEEQSNFVKDHVSKIVHSKMEKTTTTTTRFFEDLTPKNIDKPTSATTVSSTLDHLVPEDQRNVAFTTTPLPVTVTNRTSLKRPKNNFDQTMSMIYNKGNIYSKEVRNKVGLYDPRFKTTHRKTSKNRTRYDPDVRSNSRQNENEKMSSKEVVQSVSRYKPVSNVKLDDVIDALKKNIEKQNLQKEISLVVTEDLRGNNNNIRYIKPLNLLFKRVFESFNETKININNRTMRFQVKQFPQSEYG